MDRKEFFSSLLHFLKDKAADVAEQYVVKPIGTLNLRKQRPPGAVVPDSQFRALCTGCDACMKACPVDVVLIEDLETRYPVIFPDTAPCVHCVGYPCIAACETGALLRLHPGEK